MRLNHFLLASLFCFGLNMFGFAQETRQNLKVAGTCGMCKKRIEEAAVKSGASKAEWDKKSQMLKIAYDPANVSEDQIKKSIAEAGYDNETYKASEEAYNQLHECCKYSRNGTVDSTKSVCGNSEKCKSGNKCCKRDGKKKCDRESGQSGCSKDKESKRKGCCKDH